MRPEGSGFHVRDKCNHKSPPLLLHTRRAALVQPVPLDKNRLRGETRDAKKGKTLLPSHQLYSHSEAKDPATILQVVHLCMIRMRRKLHRN